MSKRASPTLVGSFVLCALVLSVAAIFVFGGGRFFRHTRTVVLFYDSNISGLGVGSTIAFRGVKLGEVTRIQTIWAPPVDDFLIKVTGEVDPSLVEYGPPGTPLPTDARGLAAALRARLETQSLVTGQLYVNLDFYPGLEPRTYAFDVAPDEVEIPTVPSTMQFFQETIRKAATTLAELPIRDLVASLESAVSGIDDFVHSHEAKQAVANLNRSLEDVQRLARSVDQQVQPTAESLRGAAQAAEDAFAQANKAIASFGSVVEADSPLGIQLADTLSSLDAMSRSVRSLTEYLNRQPNAILLGREER
ncbi:MAG TPA: MlaD family protein [Myxococcota bacterium]|jgi:paraquat-inducible protein B|nr:MlaD family protein [Myxococcota bacterium]